MIMEREPHVLITPLPLLGHVKPMLYLAELFCLAKFNVTFVSSTDIHNRLTQFTDLETRFSRYSGFEFKAVDDGLPDDHLRAGDDGAKDVCNHFISCMEPVLREIMLNEPGLEDGVKPPVTCLVVDGWLSVAHDLANEADIPVIKIRCLSAAYLWVCFCIPELVQAGEIPFDDDEESMDKLVQKAAGINSFLRNRDLPRFCREEKNALSWTHFQHAFAAEKDRYEKAHAVILNTCEELEGPVLDLIRLRCPRTYLVGPLDAHLTTRLGMEPGPVVSSNKLSNGLWEVDQSCISWLDEKPDKSVVYVSFGSIAVLEREQLIEIWAGLVQSRAYFLWAARPDLIIGSDSSELMGGTKDRGYIVWWVPQEEVLAHRAVGGFLTHSGWNSTLESITAGVPMLCWPYFGDQQVNSRWVGEVWRIGLDMKDRCDRNVVAKMVGDLMVAKKDELEKTMVRMSDLVKTSVAEGGSSYCNLDSLIEDIRQMTVKDAT